MYLSMFIQEFFKVNYVNIVIVSHYSSLEPLKIIMDVMLA